jgi:hypothetical protein
MLAVAPLIKTRLQALPALTGWAVRLWHEGGDRRPVPAVDVRCSGAAVMPKTTAAQIQPEWQVTLVVNRAADAATLLDAALDAVVGSLHNWHPGEAGGKRWEPLVLMRITEPIFQEQGLAGYELGFTTLSLYRGQD